MTENPGDGPENPFKGTPWEKLFGAAADGMQGVPDLAGLMSQMQAMLAPHEGSVNWNLAGDIARRAAAQKPDPTPTTREQDAVADAVRLADHWLDEACEFPSGVQSAVAWSRAEWIESTRDVWKVLIEPVAEHVVGAMGNALPDEARQMAGPLIGMLAQAGGAMFGQQVGTALGALAGEVLTASDIGLPLGPRGERRWCQATWRSSPRGSTSPPTTYASIWRCARPPTSDCSPTCRGCVST